MFSKKATKNDKIFTKRSSVLLLCLVFFFSERTLNVKLTVKILTIFVAFLENINFNIFNCKKHQLVYLIARNDRYTHGRAF